MNMLMHLHTRGLNTGLHSYWISSDGNVVVFPLWNLLGQIGGTLDYRPHKSKEWRNDERGRYCARNYGKGPLVWGMESWYNSNVLFLTEGIFDACRFTSKGYSAIAALSNNPKPLKSWLSVLNRPIVAVCDGDTSGLKLANYGHEYHVIENGDPGDAPEEAIYEIVRNYD